MKNMLFKLHFTNSEIDVIENVISNYKGEAKCTIGNMASKSRQHIIKVELDTDSYFGKDSPDNLLKNLFTIRSSTPFGNLHIAVSELFATIKTEEIYLGEKSTRNQLSNIIKEELSKYFFSFTNENSESDVRIEIESKIVKGKKLNHAPHTSYCIPLKTDN